MLSISSTKAQFHFTDVGSLFTPIYAQHTTAQLDDGERVECRRSDHCKAVIPQQLQ